MEEIYLTNFFLAIFVILLFTENLPKPLGVFVR